MVYRLDGPFYFAVINRFLTDLTASADIRVVILRMSGINTLDASAAKALGEIIDDLTGRHITVLIKGLTPATARLLTTVGAIDNLIQAGHLFATMPEAIRHALTHAAGTAREIGSVESRGLIG